MQSPYQNSVVLACGLCNAMHISSGLNMIAAKLAIFVALISHLSPILCYYEDGSEDIHRRLMKLLAEMEERDRIAKEKRFNLQFSHEAAFNKTYPIGVSFDQEARGLQILQLIGIA